MSDNGRLQPQLPLQESLQFKGTQGDQNEERTVSGVPSQTPEEIQARRIQVAVEIRKHRKKIEKAIAKIREKVEEKKRLKTDLVKARIMKKLAADEWV